MPSTSVEEYLAALMPITSPFIFNRTPPQLLRYIVEKGSIAIDGISLTVAKVTDSSFSVSLIPHTGEETTLLSKKVGDPVNLENDIVGKYVERFLTFEKPAETSCQSVDLAFLAEHGFA